MSEQDYPDAVGVGRGCSLCQANQAALDAAHARITELTAAVNMAIPMSATADLARLVQQVQEREQQLASLSVALQQLEKEMRDRFESGIPSLAACNRWADTLHALVPRGQNEERKEPLARVGRSPS